MGRYCRHSDKLFTHTRELSTSIPIQSNNFFLHPGTLLDLPSTPAWVTEMNKATKALAVMDQATSNTMFSVVENNQNGTDRKKAENGKDAISDIFICD